MTVHLIPARDVVAVIRNVDGTEDRVRVHAWIWNEGLRVAEPLILGEHHLWPADDVNRVQGAFVCLEEVDPRATDGGPAQTAAAMNSGRDPDANSR